MPEDYSFNKYEKDVQTWLLQQMDDAMCSVYKGEVYVNSAGHTYQILEDSLAGEVYVRVISDYPIKSTRYVSKAVVLG